MNLEELMASTPPMQQHALIKGFQAGAASRDAEVQRLQFALADSEALELGTAERCDQLRAQINMLREALEHIKMRVSNNELGHAQLDIRQALASTPEQSLAEYRNKVIEECAAVLNVAITRLSSCGASIKNDVAISTLKEQSCRLHDMKEQP